MADGAAQAQGAVADGAAQAQAQAQGAVADGAAQAQAQAETAMADGAAQAQAETAMADGAAQAQAETNVHKATYPWFHVETKRRYLVIHMSTSDRFLDHYEKISETIATGLKNPEIVSLGINLTIPPSIDPSVIDMMNRVIDAISEAACDKIFMSCNYSIKANSTKGLRDFKIKCKSLNLEHSEYCGSGDQTHEALVSLMRGNSVFEELSIYASMSVMTMLMPKIPLEYKRVVLFPKHHKDNDAHFILVVVNFMTRPEASTEELCLDLTEITSLERYRALSLALEDLDEMCHKKRKAMHTSTKIKTLMMDLSNDLSMVDIGMGIHSIMARMCQQLASYAVRFGLFGKISITSCWVAFFVPNFDTSELLQRFLNYQSYEDRGKPVVLRDIIRTALQMKEALLYWTNVFRIKSLGDKPETPTPRGFSSISREVMNYHTIGKHKRVADFKDIDYKILGIAATALKDIGFKIWTTKPWLAFPDARHDDCVYDIIAKHLDLFEHADKMLMEYDCKPRREFYEDFLFKPIECEMRDPIDLLGSKEEFIRLAENYKLLLDDLRK